MRRMTPTVARLILSPAPLPLSNRFT